jgi:hypothetical protein
LFSFVAHELYFEADTHVILKHHQFFFVIFVLQRLQTVKIMRSHSHLYWILRLNTHDFKMLRQIFFYTNLYCWLSLFFFHVQLTNALFFRCSIPEKLIDLIFQFYRLCRSDLGLIDRKDVWGLFPGLWSVIRWLKHLAETSRNILETNSHLLESRSHLVESSSHLVKSSSILAESNSQLAKN